MGIIKKFLLNVLIVSCFFCAATASSSVLTPVAQSKILADNDVVKKYYVDTGLEQLGDDHAIYFFNKQSFVYSPSKNISFKIYPVSILKLNAIGKTCEVFVFPEIGSKYGVAINLAEEEGLSCNSILGVSSADVNKDGFVDLILMVAYSYGANNTREASVLVFNKEKGKLEHSVKYSSIVGCESITDLRKAKMALRAGFCN